MAMLNNQMVYQAHWSQLYCMVLNGTVTQSWGVSGTSMGYNL
jgi:hypothetical protein